MHSVSDSNVSVHTSVSTERAPFVLTLNRTNSSASPMVSIHSTQSIATLKSSSSSGATIGAQVNPETSSQASSNPRHHQQQQQQHQHQSQQSSPQGQHLSGHAQQPFHRSSPSSSHAATASTTTAATTAYGGAGASGAPLSPSPMMAPRRGSVSGTNLMNSSLPGGAAGASGTSGARSWAPKLKKGDKLCWTKGRLLGRGAHGTVFLGLESTSGTLVAVKEMEFDPDDAALTERLASLQTELRLLKKLEHPNIVGYYSAARQATSFLVFMEYVAGGSLASILDQFGRLQESLVMNFATQILTGLQYLHSNQVVHSDIKCANVLISVDGVAKLADFGSARIIDDSAQVMNGDGGTAFWMAPEVIRQEQVTPSSDIWSFGCTVLEMLTNEIPFNFLGNAFCVMSFVARGEEAIELPAYIKQTLSPVAIDLIMICLKRDPNERATIQQLREHEFFAPLRPPRQAFSGSPTSGVGSSSSQVAGQQQHQAGSVNASLPASASSSMRSSAVGPSGPSGRPESQSSMVSNGIYIAPSIIAAVSLGHQQPALGSIASAADSNRTDVSEVAVRDHLVRKALQAVPGDSAGPLRADGATSMENSHNSGAALGVVPGGSSGGGGGGNPNYYGSVSSLDTISLSELSTREVSVANGGILTTTDVVNMMSSAMQEFVAHSMSESNGREAAVNGGAAGNGGGGGGGSALHPLASRHGASSGNQTDEIITFVLDEEEEEGTADFETVESQQHQGRLSRSNRSRDRRRSAVGAGSGGCCEADDEYDGGSDADYDDDEEGNRPPRKANRIQAVLLAVTSVLVIIAVILVIIFSNGQ